MVRDCEHFLCVSQELEVGQGVTLSVNSLDFMGSKQLSLSLERSLSREEGEGRLRSRCPQAPVPPLISGGQWPCAGEALGT